MNQLLRNQLFDAPYANLFAIVDGASDPRLIPELDQSNLPAICLIPGDISEVLRHAAPHLIEIQETARFTEWLIEDGWGQHWALFLHANVGIRAMRQHCRALLNAYGPDLEPIFFRFYDPRILRTFLPTCSAKELVEFFGPIKRFIAESKDGTASHQFEIEHDQLLNKTISLRADS